MLSPKRAPVKPRVTARESGDVLPLEEQILALLTAGVRGSVFLLGSAGSGKTTALQHLAAVLPADAPVLLLDEQDAIEVEQAESDQLVVRAASSQCERPRGVAWRLAPWGDDDLIEYLLAVHRDQCASVMGRLSGTDRAVLQGVPELCRIVLDELASDPSMSDARGVLGRHLRAQLSDAGLLELARNLCLNALIGGRVSAFLPVESFSKAGFAPDLVCLLRHPQVQLLLGAEGMAADLRARGRCHYLAMRLPRELVQATASEIAGDDKVLEYLRDLIAGPPWSHPMAASLLLAACPSWVPESGRVPFLAGAYLKGAAWAGVELPQVSLRGADLSNADLTGANLDGGRAFRANLRHARLTGASLNRFKAVKADLTSADLASAAAIGSCWNGADLTNANLRAAKLSNTAFMRAKLIAAVFSGADLTGATLADADIRDADFSGTNLHEACLSRLRLWKAVFSGACFADADLRGCDLEGMRLPGMDCRRANLEGALLTDAVLPGADFENACLCETGLGNVNLERACLRGADLRRATFHMGSSRSGLLFTPIASEGTRTGFYTDDADEQSFKAPEEIRKANLCGADLRGARIDGVDFYLVDLRGALYDGKQEMHFRHCRAILESRVAGADP